MPNYQYENDGKFHTRYSDLVRAGSDIQAIKVIEQKYGLRPPLGNGFMDFGSQRHEMFDDETKKTRRTPQVFKDELGVQFDVIHCEKHMATQIFDGVIFHFTADAICKTPDLPDYKTASNGNSHIYLKSNQLMFYALLLRPHGHKIQRVHYLIEQWNKARTKIIGYRHIESEVTIEKLGQVKAWARKRTELLMAAEEHIKKLYPDLTKITEVPTV